MEQEERCFICDTPNKYVDIASTNLLGAPDLDTRPPEMMRSTIHYWVRCCVSCGYCAPALSNGPEVAGHIVQSPAYLQQKNNPAYPELANKFLCSALIKEAERDFSSAGWEAIHAAWACDDAQATEAAEKCRKKAIAFFEQARAQNASFAQGAGVEEAILADLLRRSRQFDRVGAVCRQGLAGVPETTVQKILNFQQMLARQQDAGGHTVAEINQI